MIITDHKDDNTDDSVSIYNKNKYVYMNLFSFKPKNFI